MYMRRDAVAMRVSFANTHRGVLEYLQTVVGAGSIVGKPDYNQTTWKQGLFFQVNSDLAASLLRQIVDYLIIKKEQAQLALDFQERLKDPSQKADRTWQYEVLARMRTMNKRGPSLQS
jgi:hypothetical protein